MHSLTQKVALVTGVTRREGIGAAIALELARSGADVCTAYYRPYDKAMPWGVEEAEPDAILDALRATGVQAHGVEIDLGQPEGPRTLFSLARQRFGRIDILVNNAAYSTETTVEGMTAEDLDRHYAVNLRAMILLCLEYIKGFTQDGSGRIINLTSGQGLGPMPHELAYAATKAAMIGLTKSLAREVGRLGITVNAVAPGFLETELTADMTDEQRERVARRSALQRLADTTDVAEAVAFLVSEKGRNITGTVLTVDAGSTA